MSRGPLLNRRQAIAAVGSVALVSAGLAYRGTVGAGERGRLVIGLALSNQQADFFNMVKAKALETAAHNDVELLVADARDDPAWQIDQMQGFVNRQVDAIIYLPAGASAAGVPVRAAREADIPVVTVDRNPPDAPGDSFVATDSVASAEALGEFLVETTGGEATLAVLQGQLGTTPELAREEGFELALEGVPGIRTVAEEPADWAQDEAFDVAQDMLQANPDIDTFFGRADAMALGAAQAVRARRLDHDITIVGFDGDIAGIEAVRDGVLTATMCQQTYAIGERAVTTALDLVNGDDVPKEQLLDAYLVTSENAEEFLQDHP